MPRNKLSKDLEKVARENGLLPGSALPPPSAAGLPPNCVRFSLPPSTNNLFISHGRKRVKSPKYRRWISDNEDVAGTMPKPASFPVHVCYRLCGKVNARMDGANAEKATVDLLVSAGVLPDDSLTYVTGGRWEYQPGECEPFVLVWWEEAK